jgi:tungstate transport system ATP-binding protein
MQKAVASKETNEAAQGTCVLPIRASGLRVTRGDRTILDGIDFAITNETSTTVLLGPNGAGKSVLIRVLAGLMQADSGALTWAGMPPDSPRITRIGFVFQRPVLLQRTALANIEFALSVHGIAVGDRAGVALAALAGAGLEHLANQPARELSGGEQQRVALARAVACKPEILILDEPTANLDPASTAAFERSLLAIRARGTPILLITHDLGQARRLASQVIFMHQGRIREQTPAEEFFVNPRSPEARAFLNGDIVI